ncbi:MAG: GNAT family N-acetyltransferase [Cyanobacteria bacterium P01_A01_bin.83]
MTSLEIKTVSYTEAKAAIRHIRTKVFQEEQGVAAELEFDGWDETVVHLLACLDGKAIGTARIREIDAKTFKIERLAVLAEFRKQGVGIKLMEAALQKISSSPKSLIVVHAQEYIAQLYQQLGFAIVGDSFNEAGITHVKMIKQL